MSDLIERLTAESYNFNFFQALSLLEEYFRAQEHVANPIESGRIRLSTSPSLSFPPADIAKISKSKDGVEFILTFMGLIGVSSPMPLYFTEYISRFEENGVGLRDFLSIFNHRMYTLFYRAWQKYRFISMSGLGAGPNATNPIMRGVAHLAGIDEAKLSDPFFRRVLAYTGSFAGKTRSKETLRTMVSDFFNGLPVAIAQWQGRWTDISNPPKIGLDSRLGVNAIAGTRKWDLSGKFRVSVGPLPRERFETFLPGSENIESMKKLITLFLSDPLDWDIEVKLESSELVPVVLGQNTSRLGETSSLGKSDKKSDVHAIVIG
jgi:type VI secretion system protein ImpH